MTSRDSVCHVLIGLFIFVADEFLGESGMVFSDAPSVHCSQHIRFEIPATHGPAG